MPFLLLFLSFLLTFVSTRAIIRMIRAGVGPFRNNVAGGVRIHHAVPGIVLTLVGAYLSVAVDGRRPWAEVSGVPRRLGPRPGPTASTPGSAAGA